MSEGSQNRVEPPVSPISKPFWDATRERRLVLQWCRDCDAPVHYPREACPRCLSASLEWRAASGRGEVYAVSIMHRPGNPGMADRVPYTVALVDLDEGARLMTNVVGCKPSDVRVGMRVAVTWEPLRDGRALPLFEPAPRKEAHRPQAAGRPARRSRSSRLKSGDGSKQ
ncbi:MAG: Zn-ribbon domain-containing OB-fold protein [Proteobacteria bacterium]|nr:Zn-ribbon domain-containing OB-fold protein [Pseudomonadota bacterium]